MKALVWHGKEDTRCDTVTDPEIEDDRDAIVKVTSSAICGSDLHLFHNFIPAMLPGDIMGREMMGEIVEIGRGVNGTVRHSRNRGERRLYRTRVAFKRREARPGISGSLPTHEQLPCSPRRQAHPRPPGRRDVQQGDDPVETQGGSLWQAVS